MGLSPVCVVVFRIGSVVGDRDGSGCLGLGYVLARTGTARGGALGTVRSVAGLVRSAPVRIAERRDMVRIGSIGRVR